MNSEKDADIFCLNKSFSTTRRLTKKGPDIAINPQEKYKSLLFLPERDKKKSEGGLRTKGYFKKNLPHKPLVSIVTVVYNGEKYLENTIQSVIRQSYDNIEYIVIDGASTDKTIDIIRKHENKIDYWISEEDSGIYHAMNKGISVSSGDIIGIINSDDWIESDTIKEVVDTARQLSEKDFVIHGKIARYDNRGNLVDTHGPKKIPFYHLFSTPFKHPATFISKNLYKKIGLYDEKCGLAADYDLMLRIVSKNFTSLFIDDVLTNVRLVGVSTGGSNNASNEELIRILQHNTGSWLLAFIGVAVRKVNRAFLFLK